MSSYDLSQRISKLEKELQSERARELEQFAKDFLAKLVGERRLSSKQVPTVKEILKALHPLEVIKFSDRSVTPFKLFVEFLQSGPGQTGKADPLGLRGEQVWEGERCDQLITEKIKSNGKLSYEEAWDELRAKGIL